MDSISNTVSALSAARRRHNQILRPREEPPDDLGDSLGIAGVDVIAMVVSDSGLANAEPKWWNASPLGCILIGLQPRGGWQVIQRAVQWGQDGWAKCFGVGCTDPILYQYFACSIRNRIEVYDSPRLESPMEGVPERHPWKSWDGFDMLRPTKLIDGSRGGQAFMCELLLPEAEKQYTIQEQAHYQFLSVVLVAAGAAHRTMPAAEDRRSDAWDWFVTEVLENDFDVRPQLGGTFRKLSRGLFLATAACIALDIVVLYALFATAVSDNLFGDALPYITKIVSFLTWGVGATGLLMLGGNPRVVRKESPVPEHIEKRIAALNPEPAGGSTAETTPVEPEPQQQQPRLDEKTPETRPTQVPQVSHTETLSTIASTALSTTPILPPPPPPSPPRPAAPRPSRPQATVTLHFGSSQGSVYTPDRGSCRVSFDLVRHICQLQLKAVRTWWWYYGMGWFSFMLFGGLGLQIAGTKAPSLGADMMSLSLLIATSLARGLGLAGPEDWMIPNWARRKNTSAGARLLGQMMSRTGTEA